MYIFTEHSSLFCPGPRPALRPAIKSLNVPCYIVFCYESNSRTWLENIFLDNRTGKYLETDDGNVARKGIGLSSYEEVLNVCVI